MADIKIALGKGKEYDFEGEKVILTPLTVEDFDILMDMQDETKRSDALKRLLKIYINQAFPEASEEEKGKVSFSFLQKLMECAMDVNNLGEDKE